MFIDNTRSKDMATQHLARYIKEQGIKLSAISNGTAVSYGKLQRSFAGSRALTADEFLEVCLFIKVDPKEFKTKETKHTA